MRTGIAISALALVLGFAGISVAASSTSEQTQRRASTLRAQAQELREKANHLRDGEGVRKPNVPKAVSMERKADAIDAQANKLDPQGWPP